MTLLTKLYSDKRWLFILLWLLLVAVYLPSWKAGFVADFFNALVRFNEGSFSYFINREGAYVRSLYQVTQLELYVLISIFGASPLPWFLLFMALHALNGTLIYSFFSRLFTDFRLTHANLIAVAGVLLFLFNPNITEVTIWEGGFHYLTGVMMQMLILIWCQYYLHTGKAKFVWLSGLLFALSTFTLEIFYATPFLTLFLVVGYSWKGLVDTDRTRRTLLAIFLPQLILFLLHLLTFRLLYGSWIAHYGSTTDFAINIGDVLPRLGKYVAYIVFMVGHLPEQYRLPVYSFLSDQEVCYTILGALLLLVAYIFYNYRKASPAFQAFSFLFGAVICWLVLAIPIWFDDSFSLYNSRRCYHPGVFLYMMVALAVFTLIRNLRIAYLIYSAYFLLCLCLTISMVLRWRTAAKIQHGILRTFQWQSADPVLLLNIPTYYKDVRITPAGAGNEFNKQLKIFGHDTVTNTLYSVSSYNMQHKWEGAHVTVLDSLTVKVTLNQWGNWWMYNYQGATNYENDLYQVNFTDPAHEYILKLKVRPKNMVLLFQQDEQWRAVDMNKIGVEQWE